MARVPASELTRKRITQFLESEFHKREPMKATVRPEVTGAWGRGYPSTAT